MLKQLTVVTFNMFSTDPSAVYFPKCTPNFDRVYGPYDTLFRAFTCPRPFSMPFLFTFLD